MKQTIRPIRTTFKLLLALFLLLSICGLFSGILEHIVIMSSSNDKEAQTHYLYEFISQDRYGNLHDHLNLYDLYEEEYQHLWLPAEAWHLYCIYDASLRAAEQTEDTDFRKICEERAEETRRRLEQFPADSGDKTVDAAIMRIKERLSGG
ncbi:MAG: hypothetical protein KH452_04165 [Clostridiales bacterium]|nr:hypothetical protein [Clostridiales bacterium]